METGNYIVDYHDEHLTKLSIKQAKDDEINLLEEVKSFMKEYYKNDKFFEVFVDEEENEIFEEITFELMTKKVYKYLKNLMERENYSKKVTKSLLYDVAIIDDILEFYDIEIKEGGNNGKLF